MNSSWKVKKLYKNIGFQTNLKLFLRQQQMKTLKAVVIILIFISSIIGFFYYRFHASNIYPQLNEKQINVKILEESAEAYLNATLPKIFESWSKEAFMNEASPRLKQLLTKDTIFINRLKQLPRMGRYQAYSIQSHNIKKVKTLNDTQEILGTYRIIADFEKVRATIDLKLILVDGQWKILVFNVFTPMILSK